ncbi:MAG: NifB/NifX family molybdenum-iron cluster-binding protein [Sedimentisphaerales bacterium]|jgi:predicted Fe-Mo cluster-binding NifX family protein|nr:NifB/NifX family molybdenum-iron cluster-binding protein [Sedimentisphaerales bacterium]
MRIAVPIANGRLCAHFGHADGFAIVEVDPGQRHILDRKEVDAPPHAPGLLPRWLAEQGVDVVVAGGMGQRAKALFSQNGITVVVGAPALEVDELVAQYLAGTLQTGENLCDH